MIHALDPGAAAFIAIGYLGFVFQYIQNTTAAGRRSRAGRSMRYLLAVIVLCACTSYLVQFLPVSWQWVRAVEGWALAVASIGLLVSGCGARLGRAMNYETALADLDECHARLAEIEATP